MDRHHRERRSEILDHDPIIHALALVRRQVGEVREGVLLGRGRVHERGRGGKRQEQAYTRVDTAQGAVVLLTLFASLSATTAVLTATTWSASRSATENSVLIRWRNS